MIIGRVYKLVQQRHVNKFIMIVHDKTCPHPHPGETSLMFSPTARQKGGDGNDKNHAKLNVPLGL